MAGKLLTYACSECGRPLGAMPSASFTCPRTRRMAQPRKPVRRRTSLPLEVRRQRAECEFREFLDVREARAKKRRRRARLTVTIERPE